jgi:type VI secretion system protein VasG
LPDKAVDLLDTAAARVRMSLDTLPEQLTRLQARLTALAMEQQELLEDISLGNAVDASRLPQIEQLTLDLNQQKTALQSQYETESSSPTR